MHALSPFDFVLLRVSPSLLNASKHYSLNEDLNYYGSRGIEKKRLNSNPSITKADGRWGLKEFKTEEQAVQYAVPDTKLMVNSSFVSYILRGSINCYY
jgi:hypothetical protein